MGGRIRRAHRERLGLDPEIDIETAVLYTWAVELGLGVLEAFGMEPNAPEEWAAVQRRLAEALLANHDTTAAQSTPHN